MATSVEKIQQLTADLPSVLQTLQLPPMVGIALSGVMPLADGYLQRLLSQGPEYVDEMIDRAAAAIVLLKSDPPAELPPAA